MTYRNHNRLKLYGILLLLVYIFSVLGAAKPLSSQYLAQVEKKYGEYAKRRLIAWYQLSNDDKNKDEKTKVEDVNRFFNLFEYKSDKELWGKSDYWATPLEFILAGAGDCEDYAIAKYYTLLNLGVADDKLLITYVKIVGNDTPHMVLTYYAKPDGIPLIMDSLNKELLPADQRKDLIPIYSFNGKGLWRAKQTSLGNKIGNSEELKQWVDLEKRMKSQNME